MLFDSSAAALRVGHRVAESGFERTPTVAVEFELVTIGSYGRRGDASSAAPSKPVSLLPISAPWG
jgi:hypothetical protein